MKNMSEEKCDIRWQKIIFKPVANFLNNLVVFSIIGYVGLYAAIHPELLHKPLTDFYCGFALIGISILMICWNSYILINTIRINLERYFNRNFATWMFIVLSILLLWPLLSFIVFVPYFFNLSIK